MSYNKYVDSVFAYGGKMTSKKYPNGGDVNSLTTKPVEPILTNSSFPDIYGSTLPIGGLPTNPIEQIVTPKADIETELLKMPGFSDLSKKERTNIFSNIGRDELALLGSNLPALSNLIGSMQGNTTKFDRIKLDDINLDNERRIIGKAASNARNVNRKNVRGTASSAGEALAGLSAGNAGITSKEMDALARVGAQESNANIQIDNQEKLTNANTANQEALAIQQDEAMKASMRNLGLSDIGTNVQGYLKDQSLQEEAEAFNTRLMSLLKTGEYQLIDDGKGGYTTTYLGKPSVADLKEAKNSN